MEALLNTLLWICAGAGAASLLVMIVAIAWALWMGRPAPHAHTYRVLAFYPDGRRLPNESESGRAKLACTACRRVTLTQATRYSSGVVTFVD